MARLNQSLPDSLVVRVMASDGGTLPGATIDWTATAGGGRFSNPNTTTDASGQSSTVFILGSFPVQNVAQAEVVSSGQTVNFTAQATNPTSVTVTMQNTAFNAPGGGQDVTIMLGDTVRWMNLDAVQHTATSMPSQNPSDRVPEGGRTFNTGFLNQNESAFFVPNVRGLWLYHCEAHPVTMQGAQITVE